MNYNTQHCRAVDKKGEAREVIDKAGIDNLVFEAAGFVKKVRLRILD